MKILIVQPTGDKRGHYGIYTANLCQAMAGLGHDVTLCTNKLDVTRYLRDTPAFRLWEVANGRFGFERFDAALERFPLLYYWGYFRNSCAVSAAAARLSQRERFDALVIMDTEFMTASLILRWHRRTIPPVIMFLWAANFSFTTYPGSVFKRAYKVLQRGVFRAALGRGIQALAVLDEWHRDRLRPQLGLPPDFPIVVIPDGADPAPEMPEKIAARRMLELNEDVPILLFFGALRKDKGVEYLLEAISALTPELKFTLVIAGWPMEYTADQILQMIDRLRVGDRVVLRLGYVSDRDVPSYFAACDVLILPYAKAYTGGSGPLTKGACTYRRPVIASRVSGMGQLVEEHHIGLVAEPEDPRALASKIREFLSLSENDRDAMATNAARLAAASSWDVVATLLVSAVRQICAR